MAQDNQQNLQVEGSEWKTASVALHADPSQLTVDKASLVNAHQGQMNLSARVAKWLTAEAIARTVTPMISN